MGFTLDSRDASNTISLNQTLPDDNLGNTILLDFVSEYDRQEYFRSVDVTQQGAWLTGTIDNDRIPNTDTYKVTVHSTVQDHLALKDIHIPLSQILVPLKDIVGPSRAVTLKTLQATVIGEDYQTQTVPEQTIDIITEYTGTTDVVVERVSDNENAKGTTYR